MADFTINALGREWLLHQDVDGKFLIPDEIRPLLEMGSALKPAWEPICMARKPLIGTVAENVLQHGTGAINIDGCRIPADGDKLGGGRVSTTTDGWDRPWKHDEQAVAACIERGAAAIAKAESLGRWPANLIHDGSEEVLAAFPQAPGQQAAVRPDSGSGQKTDAILGKFATNSNHDPRGDSGSAARFFYSAKADKGDRLGSKHPTVKPVDLMAYLCRLVTRPGGLVLDPFAGSGTTGMACMREGLDAILIEREAQFVEDIKRRIAHVSGQDGELFR